MKACTMNDLEGAYHIVRTHPIAFPILVQKE